MTSELPPKHLAFISLHTSPIATLGLRKSGGMNVYLYELARELAGRGHRVDIFTHRAQPNLPEIDESIAPGVRVIRLPLAQSFAPFDHEQLHAARQQFAASLIAFATGEQLRYSLCYSHYWLSGWVAAKLKEIWRIPFVQMFHTLGQMKQRIAGSGFPSTRTRMEQNITDWADAIIAATPSERAQLRWLYRADRRKIHIVPPGVDRERFHPQAKGPARQALAIPQAAKVLLFVGRIEPLKAVDDILRAINIIRRKRPQLFDELRILVVGGGAQEIQKLRRLGHQLGLNTKKTLQFLGPRPQTELPKFYAAADAVVMPSDYESFGMVVLEAMASGRPVIATQVGGLAHLVLDGQTGYHIPTRDSAALAKRIIDLLKDSNTATWMGEQATRRARQYAWPLIADELLRIFASLLSRVRCNPE